jgi:phosphohistidine swiveling domain-containing protein
MLRAIEQKIAQGLRPHPFLHGRATVYGVMPDWNPAEIIGVRPRPLALSLYRELITDAIWAYQRHNYGYKNLRSFPLLLHFHGLPYIDVRVSFNSFIPEDIEGGLADRLVDYYIDRLLETPSLHDKVEFDIVFSCYALDLPKRLAILEERGFTLQECTRLADSLRRLTNRIIHQKSGLWRADQERLEVLARRRDAVLAANLDPVARIYWLLEDCKRYGTLPFAGLARAGFIAVQILRSLVAEGVFTQADFDAFMASLNTVSSQLARDMSCLDRTTFVNKYGHLRPGTYDILSPRYDEAPDLYFDWSRTVATKASHGENGFSLGIGQMRQISAMLGEHGLDIDVVGLFDFLQAGIEMREYSKFVFTRNLSDTLSLMRHVGGELGFSVDDMSYADVAVFYELHGASTDARTLLARSIEQGRERHAATCRLWLPPLITQATDVWGFHLPVAEPNFITQKTVIAPVVPYADKDRLAGAIVAIPSADPGFDWLFSHPIAGLITAYGGVNSHMAIRAGELALPAVIGAGETQFAKWSAAKRLALDCANRRVQVLS